MVLFRRDILLCVVLHVQVKAKQCSCRAVRDIASSEAHGWEESCDGLKLVGSQTAEFCRASCCKDTACTAWFLNGTGCFHGQAEQCGHLESPPSASHEINRTGSITGQIMMRGEIVVNAPRYLMRCEGLQSKLFHAPMARTTSDLMAYRRFALSGIDRCRSVCYANPGCTVWQYGAQGCSYSTTDVACSPDEALAAEITAGEHITNRCHDAGLPGNFSPDELQRVFHLDRVTVAPVVLVLLSALVLVVHLRTRCCKCYSDSSEVRTAVLQENGPGTQVEYQEESGLPAKTSTPLQSPTAVQYLRQTLVMPLAMCSRAPQPLPLPMRVAPPCSSRPHQMQYRPLQVVRTVL